MIPATSRPSSPSPSAGASPGTGVFFHQGAPASGLHVLVQGRTKLVQTTVEGHQVVVRIVAAGDMFGGVALLGDAVYPATAEAISAS